MTNEILQSINQKNRLYKTLVHTDTDNTDLFNRRKDEYKQYRAYLRKQIREAKRKYYDHIFSLYKNDIKNTWKILNETLNRNRRKHQSQDFLINNELVNDPDIIVNEFNAYFVNIAENLADSTIFIFATCGPFCKDATHMYLYTILEYELNFNFGLKNILCVLLLCITDEY